MSVKPPVHVVAIQQEDTVHPSPWFERDRAHVSRDWKAPDGESGETIMQWWDEAVSEAVDDGFLDPKDYHRSAFEYAQERGMLAARQTELSTVVPALWPQVLAAFVEATPAADRPVGQIERQDWLYDQALTAAEKALAEQTTFKAIPPRLLEEFAETFQGALYDRALLAEQDDVARILDTLQGKVSVHSDGKTVTLRGGMEWDLGDLKLSDCKSWSFALDLSYDGDTVRLERETFLLGFDPRDRPSAEQTDDFHRFVDGLVKNDSSEMTDAVHAAREKAALKTLNEAIDRLTRDGFSEEAAVETVAAHGKVYDAARAERAKMLISDGLEPEIMPSPRM